MLGSIGGVEQDLGGGSGGRWERQWVFLGHETDKTGTFKINVPVSSVSLSISWPISPPDKPKWVQMRPR